MAAVPTSIDAKHIAEILAARFRLDLYGEDTVVPCIRAAGLKRPNGFAVQVTPGWRSVEASFVADNFAGELIRTMGEAPIDARESYRRTAEAFLDMGIRLSVRVNESAITDPRELPVGPWARFDLKALRMSAASTLGREALLRDSADVGGACLALVLCLLPLEEDSADAAHLFEAGLPEGAKTRVEINRYERSAVNRAACIAKFGAICNACGFDFGSRYGPAGDGYIEVHHTVPVSQMTSGYVIRPTVDLVPLCANCHAVVHRRDPPLTVSALVELLRKQKALPN